jgi:general secretion pathway protein E
VEEIPWAREFRDLSEAETDRRRRPLVDNLGNSNYPLIMEAKRHPFESPRHRTPELAVRLNGLLSGSMEETSDEEGLIAHGDQVVRYLLQDAVDRNASDIHFNPCSAGWRLRFRVDGRLHDVAQLTAELGLRTVRRLKALAGVDPVASFVPQDARARLEVLNVSVDLRLALTPCLGGEALNIRILNPTRVRHRIGDLGMEKEDVDHLIGWLSQTGGICLVTGPTGSGKTTTLYSLLHELEMSDHSIITIEDPVEYSIDGITQIQVDEPHGLTFAEGLKAILRMDPDYMLVGEIRDAVSARTAVEAAASGHVVMSTLHSPDAAGVLTLLRNWEMPDHQIATGLEVVVNQRLVRRLCQKCRRHGPPHSTERHWLESLDLPVPSKTFHATGCRECMETGYSGRVGVFETWRCNESDYTRILNHVDEHSLRQHLRARGLRSVLDDGLSKAAAGTTSLSEIRRMGAHQFSLRGAFQGTREHADGPHHGEANSNRSPAR